MMKEIDVPPIRKNPRLGKETEQDASVMYGGAQLPEKKKRKPVKRPARKRRQKSFTIKNEATLRQLSETLGITEAAVVNLGIARLVKEYL